MADKEVKIKVATENDLSGVKPIEDEINKLKQQKIELDIKTNTSRLEEVNSKIESTKSKLSELKGKADVDDTEVKQLETELDRLESEKIDLQLAIEEGKLKSVESEIEDLDGTTIDVDVNNISAMEALEQIGQGFDRLKQGASEVGQQLGSVLEAAGKQETNKTFLVNAVGADTAKQKLEEINTVVQQLPGDDTVLQGLLSSAVANDASLTADALREMGTAATDYFSAMSYYGKSATEAQQDMTNYLLAGNTAELERSPILQGHIDKLKEGKTVQERSLLLQQALNDEHWGGMSTQDTYNNKLETFNGMLERGRYNLGGMLQEGAKWGMDFLINLDQASGGIVGMGIALAGFASPLTDCIMGLGQMATGLKALKDAGDILGLVDKLRSLKTVVIDAADALKTLALRVLESGYNALKSAAMWAYQKLALVASTIAEYGLAAAQAVLNFVMSINPIVLIVLALIALAAALIWAYQNVDWFREMVNNLWAGLQQLASFIWDNLCGALQWLGQIFAGTGQIMQDTITNAVNWIISALQGLWTYIITLGGLLPENVSITGNQIIDTILRVVLFLLTLPMQIGMIFTNIIAKTLGFGDNFVQNMIRAGSQSVSNFMSWISSLPGKLAAELNNMLSTVNEWAATLPAKFWEAGVNAVKNFLDALGIHSPGTMQRMLTWEITEMGKNVPDDSRKLVNNIGDMGENIVDAFGNPSLSLNDIGNGNGNLNDSLSNLNVLQGGVGGDIIVNVYGDIDNDKRIRELVEAVRKELSWNNKTAGRTV